MFSARSGYGAIYEMARILDAFRRVDEATLLGVMDQRGMPEPFLFLLRREFGRRLAFGPGTPTPETVVLPTPEAP